MPFDEFRLRLESERRRLIQPDYLEAKKRSQERERRKRRACGLPPRNKQPERIGIESQLREHEKKHAPVPFTPDDIPDWLPEGWESTRRPADSDFDYVAEWFRNEIVLYESSASDDEVITGGKDVYPAVADAYRLVGVFQLRSPNTEPTHRTWRTFDVSEKGRKTALSELKNAWAWILNVSIYLVSIDMADLAAPLPEPVIEKQKSVTDSEMIVNESSEGKEADSSGADGTIHYLGGQKFSIDGKEPIVVTETEKCVMNAFLVEPAMDTETLNRKSNVKNSPQILRKLETKYNGCFKSAIYRPGGRGQGGYRVSIIDASGS